ncbi:MAG: hypothetical protein ACOYBY_14270 [Dermatophilaceae bacterium]
MTLGWRGPRGSDDVHNAPTRPWPGAPGGHGVAGYTPQLAAAVWVGNPDGTTHPMTDVVVAGRRYTPVNGGSIAAPIWRDVMTAASAQLPVVPFPAPAASGG